MSNLIRITPFALLLAPAFVSAQPASVSVADFGAKGDGATDDTKAVQQAARAAAGKTLVFPKTTGAYRISDTVEIAAGTHVAGGGSRILMAFPAQHASGRLFQVSGSDVEIEGVWIDAAGIPAATAGNKYAIAIFGTAQKRLQHVRVRNSRVTNLPWVNAKEVIATHAIYVKWADFTTVENCFVESVSGAGVFVSQSDGVSVINNDLRDTGWYSIQLQDLVDGALVAGNRISGTVPGGRMWGGSINIMSNGRDLGAGKARDRHILITGNSMTGVHSYTAAVHIESASFVSFTHNVLEGVSLTSREPPTYVRVYTRPQGLTPGTSIAKTDEGPNDNIDISENRLVASGPDCIGIYIDNQRFGGQHGYASGVSVRNNTVVSPDESNTFAHAIIVNGQGGGWKNVEISGNHVSGRPLTNPQAGLIGVIGRTGVPVIDVLVENNVVQQVGKALGPPHLGIALEQFVERVVVRGNDVSGFWHGIRTFANANAVHVENTNVFHGSANADRVLTPQTAQTTVAPTPVIARFSAEGPHGSDAIMGTVPLSGGSATVETRRVRADIPILVAQPGGNDPLRVSSRTPGASFIISSGNPADHSTAAWLLVHAQ